MASSSRALPKPPDYSPPLHPQSDVKQIQKRSQSRETAIQDLYAAEQHYNALLRSTIQHYVTPLKNYQIISEKQHRTLFPELQSIKELSDTFLEDLNQRRLQCNWRPNSTKLSDLFDRFIPFFRMYQFALNNHDKTLELLQQLSQNKKWITFCQTAQLKCHHIPLSNLLMIPSEQLVKYDTLLSNILKHTTPQHVDYNDLNVSHKWFTKELQHMKVKMLDCKRKDNVRKIERKFKGHIHLSEPHRSFICGGKLWKISARSTKDRLYQFFLFNDILLYASSFGNKYKIHNMLPINEKFHVDMFKADKKYGKEKDGRIFFIKSEKKSIVVYAETIALAQEWLRQLNLCIAQQNAPGYLQSRAAIKSFRKSFTSSKSTTAGSASNAGVHHRHISTETLPVWVPDSHVTNCSVCCTKFTFTQRKHHCRKCGAVACNKCSKYKLWNSEGVLQRACKTCFVINANTVRAPKTDTPYVMAMPILMDDDSDPSDFENEIQCLYALPYYIETSDYQWIFDTFGGKIGSYMLIPSSMDSDEYYYVNLVVYTKRRYELFKISLFEKKHKNDMHMVFRLVETNMKSNDFDGMDKLLRYLEAQYKDIEFRDPMLRSTVEAGVEHSIAMKHRLSVCLSMSNQYPKAEALYDYESKADGDLSFKAGDTIDVCDQNDATGWWKGFIGDCVGVFPSNYVRMLSENNDDDDEDADILDEVNQFPANVIEMDQSEGDMKETQVKPMQDGKRQFYNFLKGNNLEKYFDQFKLNEVFDIRDIEYLVDENDFLRDNIGIKNPIHRKKLLGEIGKLKQRMDAFNQIMNNIPDMLMGILLSFGIVTMDILCSEIKQKSDLKDKLKIETDSQCDLLWGFIEKQRHPNLENQQTEGQGQLIPETKGGPDDMEDLYNDPDDDQDNDALPQTKTPKINFVTPNNQDISEDKNIMTPPPPLPPI
eukprot:111650_1